jgi:hypothetical protein
MSRWLRRSLPALPVDKSKVSGSKKTRVLRSCSEMQVGSLHCYHD